MPDFPVSAEFAKTANPAQLHDQARGNLVKWPASITSPDGGKSWVYRVERDDIDATKVTAAIESHTPDPDYGMSAEVATLRAFVAKTSPTAADVAGAVKALIKVLAP